MILRNIILSFLISLLVFLISFIFLRINLIISLIYFGVFVLLSLFFLFFYSKTQVLWKKKFFYIFLGIIWGIIFYFLLEVFVNYYEWETNISNEIKIFVFFFSAIIGAFLGLYKSEIVSSFSNYNLTNQELQDEEVFGKILDSSVIIDGRILKIAKTNFIEGYFIIPNFVLREIQLISDSSDPVKRNRGRRGLDMLNELQKLNNIKVKISYIDYPEIRDVDSKLVRLARDTNGKLITNDFNLEKVAEVQGIQVLNLNALTEALRPIVLPGEELKIQVVKEGKDENQGIGYLDDGTMVVIEDGKELISKVVKVVVTSIIQTAAGKMIFTKVLQPVMENSTEENLTLDKNKKKKK